MSHANSRHQHPRSRIRDWSPDDDILQDGETVRVPMRLMDSLQRSVATATTHRIHDGRGNVGDAAVHRPGPRYLTRDANTHLVRDQVDLAYRDYDDQLTNAWRGRDAWSASEGDSCTVRDIAGGDVGFEGDPGTLQRRGGRLVCVSTTSRGARGKDANPNRARSQYSRADRVVEVREAILNSGADEDEANTFVAKLERTDDLDQDTGEYIRQFWAQATTRASVAEMEERRADAMDREYAKRDIELRDAWRHAK